MSTTVSELSAKAGRLDALAGSVSENNVADVLDSAIALFDDVPGDPDGIDDLSTAFSRAATGVNAVGEDTALTGSSRLTRVWTGEAADAASATTVREGDRVSAGRGHLDGIATTLSGLAERVRTLKSDHGAVRQAMIDLRYRAMDGAEPSELTTAAAETIRRGGTVLTEAAAAHQEAATNLRANGTLQAAPPPPDPNPGRLTPQQILEMYQTPVDPRGTVNYPPFPLSLVVDQQTVTKTEAEMLERLGLAGQKDLYDIRNDAFGTAQDRFPNQDGNDSHQDAFRHAYWNALMVRRFGPEWAENYATAHEGLPGNPADREAMDLYNNEVGRRIAIENPDASPEELANLVEQAVRGGDTVVIDRNGDLQYSNDVPDGQTGRADDPPTEPGEADPDSDSADSTGSGDESGDYESGSGAGGSW